MQKTLVPFFSILCLLLTLHQRAAAQMTEQQLKETFQKTGVNLTPDQMKQAADAAKNVGAENADKAKMEQTQQNLKEAEIKAAAEAKQQSTIAVKDGEKTTARTEEEKLADALLEADNKALAKSGIYGHHLYRQRTIKALSEALNTKPSEKYLIGVGDEISVNVWGRAEFSGVQTVNTEGYIKFFQMPRLYVRGMQYKQLQEKLTSQFSQSYNLKTSQIAVALNYSRVITVNVVGEVMIPKSYTMSAINTAVNALAAADGPTDLGSVRNIKISSSGKPDRTLDLYKFLLNPLNTEEFFIENNDYIYVPPVGRVVRIGGAIKRPFEYELIAGENLNALITWAGGLSANAYKGNLQIKRFENDEIKLIDISLNDLEKNKTDVTLKNGDIVTISTIDPEYFTNFATVSGAVKQVGTYQLEKGKTRINDLLEKAAMRDDAVKSLVYIRRMQPDRTFLYYTVNAEAAMKSANSKDNILLEEKDEIFVLSKTDFFDKKQTIAVLGVVRNPGDDFGFAQNMTLRDALIRANGFNTGADISRIELERFEAVAGVSAKSIVKEIKLRDTVLFRNYDPQLDMKLQNSDRIIVRTIPNFKGYRFVSIKGEVKYPGEYLLLKDDEKLLDLIERAGGLTAIAAPRDAVLTRSDTEENLGFILMDLEKAQATPNSTYNYKLKQGDLITVPATREFVTIQGAVESEEVEAYKRVSIAYQEGKDIPYYIDEYVGGIDREKRGRYYLTSVRYPNGVTKKTKSYFFHLIKKYPPIRAGAIITVKAVPEKAKKADGSNNGETKKVDWESVMQKTTAAITTILLITTLGTQLSASIGGR